MNDFRADLHCHSNCSDGTASPEEIVKMAQEKGLQGLSITDHDTIEAYKTALPMAQNLNVSLISGVEFSTVHNNASIHILGYSFSLNNPLIKEFCLKHVRRRLDRNKKILSLLKDYGMPIEEEDIQEYPATPEHIIGRPHIALAMVKKGYVLSIQDAFNKYIGEGKPCYTTGGYFTTEETIDLIHQANGFAIIAHPHLIESNQIVDDLLNMKFDGIEGYYARFLAHQQEKWVKIGEKKNWLITGGSDFHGDIKPASYLGSSWVNQTTFKVLQERFIINQIKSM